MKKTFLPVMTTTVKKDKLFFVDVERDAPYPLFKKIMLSLSSLSKTFNSQLSPEQNILFPTPSLNITYNSQFPALAKFYFPVPSPSKTYTSKFPP
jgi:hypothetical protein